MLTLRTATLSDLPTITRIQAACYTPFLIESQAAFASKLQQAAQTCWLACVDQQLIAYLICLPVSSTTFPALNAAGFQLAADASMLYIHDLAVHPDYRASGAGRLLIQHAKSQARQLGFYHLSLIAVQDSRVYWQKQGFAATDPASLGLEQKVASFGADACLMMQSL